MVAFGEGVELGGVFAEDDEGFGVKAEFGRVAGGCALPSGEVGPFDLAPLARLDCCCFRVDITEIGKPLVRPVRLGEV